MARKYDKYELEIIVSLGILILFLISVNFISGYSFERAVRTQAVQFEDSADIAASLIKFQLDKDLTKWEQSTEYLYDRLRDLAVLTGIDDISVVDTLGQTIASLKQSDEAPVKPPAGITIKRPLKTQNGRTVAYAIVSSVNKTGASYILLSRWDVVFRIGGVLSALVVAFFFLRAVLNPYRLIKKEALDYNLDLKYVDSGKGIEYIVNTFKEVIDELEDKKARLQIMYDNSEKRADSLARYNDYILGSISSGVVICDSSGHITRFNRSAEEILKYFERDCRGKHYRSIFGNDHKLTSMLDDALQREITHSREEFEVRRPDGERLWLGCSSSMINDEKGDGMGAVLLMIDLTEIRRLQELSTYSEKMASLGEMSAGLAHEIRNSFAAVLGFARLLTKKAKLSKEDSKLVLAVMKEADTAETLLSRFLNFARPLDFCPEPIDLQSIIDSTVKSLVHRDLAKIKIEVQRPENIPRFLADPVLLKQALSNLLLNACDAMPEGGAITIETTRLRQKNGREEIAMAVSDTGIGISPERVEKIFEPFHSEKPDGIGLGLALVKKIVVLHEGQINVKSKPGKGTRIIINLPLKPFEDHQTSLKIKTILSA